MLTPVVLEVPSNSSYTLQMSPLTMQRLILHSNCFTSVSCFVWCWQNFRWNDLQINFCVDVWATATRVQLSQVCSLNDSTENICRETSDGGLDLASRHMTCNECFSSTSERRAENWALQPPNHDKIYVQQQVVLINPCHHPNKLLCWARSCGTRVIFASWHKYSYIMIFTISPQDCCCGYDVT